MLVLSRRVNESVAITMPNGMVGRVMVVEVRPGGKVRLGFDFPRETPIHRSEIQSRIETQEAKGESK